MYVGPSVGYFSFVGDDAGGNAYFVYYCNSSVHRNCCFHCFLRLFLVLLLGRLITRIAREEMTVREAWWEYLVHTLFKRVTALWVPVNQRQHLERHLDPCLHISEVDGLQSVEQRTIDLICIVHVHTRNWF